MNDKVYEKVLVRGVNWIGDAVMTIPALRALRKARPNSSVSLLARPSVASLFERDPGVDEIILYAENHRSIAGKYRLSRDLRERRFSMALLLQNAFDAALISFLARIPERLGYNRDGRGFLLTRPVACRNENRRVHHIEYYLNLLRAAGIAADSTQPWLFQSLEERLGARRLLSALRRPVLGMNPGAAYGSAKRWLPARFGEVGRRFVEDTGGSVVLVGGSHDMGTAGEIAGLIAEGPTFGDRPGDGVKADNPVLSLAGKTSLRELISVISECDLFLSNDSGPMHIAYAVGTPLVALFGSTAPLLTGPVGEGHAVIQPEVGCNPCFERTCGKGDLRCMHAIHADDVYTALMRLLPARPAVLFDRDGTLCRDAHYLNAWKDFEELPGMRSLRRLKEEGFCLIGITNQSGIARGLVREEFVREVNSFFMEKRGFDGFYYCPHRPEDHCHCRKPETGLAATSRARHLIDLKRSYVVGDKRSDMDLAQAVGAKAILISPDLRDTPPYADVVATGIEEAVTFILNDGGR